MLTELLTNEQLSAHIEKTDPVRVKDLSKLDRNVHRIDLEDGKSWVARVYSAENQTAVERLAKLLEHIHVYRFPTEELVPHLVAATDDGDACILVTNFVHGKHPERNKATFFRLGKLLGQLHGMHLGHGMPAEGAWHYLCMPAGMEQECEAAIRMLA